MPESTVIVEDFTPEIKVEAILAQIPEAVKGKAAERLPGLVADALKVAKPKGRAFMSAIDHPEKNATKVGDTVFKSPLVYEKTDGLGRVFPYIATEGVELSAWGDSLEDSLDKVLSHYIRQLAVKDCEKRLEDALKAKYDIPILSALTPGSLVSWPIDNMPGLFEVLGEHPQNVGARLKSSFIMHPDYSVAGLFFQTDKKYYNCQLCPKDDCPNRKAKRIVDK